MTNFENFKSMSIDEFAAWLDEHGQFDGSPWMDWFSRTYCDKCETEKVYVEAFHRETDCSYCELRDPDTGESKCRYFVSPPDNLEIIKMWLGKTVKSENKA